MKNKKPVLLIGGMILVLLLVTFEVSTGFFQGAFQINPVNGKTEKRVKIVTERAYDSGDTITAEFKDFGTTTSLLADTCGKYISVERKSGSSYVALPNLSLCNASQTNPIAVNRNLEIEFTIRGEGKYRLKAYVSSNQQTTTVTSSKFRIKGGNRETPVVSTIKIGTFQQSTTATTTPTPNPATVVSVSVLPAAVTKQVSQTHQFTAAITPTTAAQTVTWNSSNTAVATITGTGLATGVSVGTTTITATSTVDATKRATAVLTVTAQPVVVNSVSVTPPSATKEVGQTLQLTATVAPAGVPQTVTWRSSNTAAATISAAGLVTALAPGSTVLTATSTQDPTKTASATLTVTPSTAVTAVAVSPTSATKTVGQTQQFTATVTPAIAAQTVTWVSSNTAIATVNTQGLATAISAGSVTLTAISTGDPNKQATATFTVTAPVAPRTVQANIQNFAFSPGTINISVGDTVVWTNRDTSQHTVTSLTGAFGSSLMSQNATFSHTFTSAGTFNYRCDPHPGMTGQVVVTQP